MAHQLLLGVTESGKSTVGIILAELHKKRKNKVVVLDPLLDPRWKADFITSDPKAFLKYCKENQNCYIFIDEGATSIGRYNPEMEWVTTQSRHWGHVSTIIAHRWQQLPPTLRSQTSTLFLFSCSLSDTRDIADEWRQPSVADVQFQKGDFYILHRHGPMEKGRVDFAEKKVYYESIEIPKKADKSPTGNGRKTKGKP